MQFMPWSMATATRAGADPLAIGELLLPLAGIRRHAGLHGPGASLQDAKFAR